MKTLSTCNRNLAWLVMIWTFVLSLGLARAGFCAETTTLAELQSAAAAGNADAQYALGDAYYFAQGLPSDPDAAFKWYGLAAQQGHSAAQFSATIIERAATEPQPGTVLPMLRGLFSGDTHRNDVKEGLASVQREAQLGNAIAQWKVGIAYATGTSVRRNDKEAVEWLRQAAEQNLTNAKYSLGHAYQEGLGVRRNEAEALSWFRRAADEGHESAQFALGYAYEYGRGVLRDYAEAAKWYRLAAEQGDPRAQFNLGFFCEMGQGVAKDPVEAIKWYRFSADQGYSRAFLNLGAANLEGVGTVQSYPDALFYFLLAASTQDPAVQGMAQNGIKLAKRHLDDSQIADAQKRVREWPDVSSEASPTTDVSP